MLKNGSTCQHAITFIIKDKKIVPFCFFDQSDHMPAFIVCSCLIWHQTLHKIYEHLDEVIDYYIVLVIPAT